MVEPARAHLILIVQYVTRGSTLYGYSFQNPKAPVNTGIGLIIQRGQNYDFKLLLKVYHNRACANIVPVFPQVNSLPGAEHQLAIAEGDADLGGGKR